MQFRGPASPLFPRSLLKRWCPQTGVHRRRRRRNSPIGTASGSPWTTPLFHRRVLKGKPIHNTLFLLFFGCSSQSRRCHRHRRWRRRVPGERQKGPSSPIYIAAGLKRILTNILPFFNFLSSPTKNTFLSISSLNKDNQKQKSRCIYLLLSFHFYVKNLSIFIGKSRFYASIIRWLPLRLWLEKQH